jgi:hypothetical protein
MAAASLEASDWTISHSVTASRPRPTPNQRETRPGCVTNDKGMEELELLSVLG